MTLVRWASCGVMTLAGTLLLAAAGCGGGGQDEGTTKKELADIGLLYKQFCAKNPDKGPSRAEDLEPFADQGKDGYDALKAYRYVVLWRAPMKAILAAGKDKVVLAYEKGVPVKGGWVVLGNDSVVKMTPDEYQRSPKVNIPLNN
jgi:hypothetical protein